MPSPTTQMTFSDFSNYVSIVSGLMTIFGVSGIAAWSIAERLRSKVAAHNVLILAYSLKVSLACFLFISTLFCWRLLYVYLGNGTVYFVTHWWDATQPITNILAYIA